MLANIPEQQQSGDTASEDDIGEELQACLAGHEEAESAAAKPVSLPFCFAHTKNRQRSACKSMFLLRTHNEQTEVSL